MFHQLAILTLFAMLSTGCSFGTSVTSNGDESPQLDIAPSTSSTGKSQNNDAQALRALYKNANYSPQLDITPHKQACRVDDDCIATPKRDGSCCPDTCKPTLNIYNRDNFKKLEAQQAEFCIDGQFDCQPPLKCKPLPYLQDARCKDGFCTIVKDWLDSPAPR